MTIVSTCRFLWLRAIYRRTSCIGVSAWSTKIRSAGLYFATCRAISDPIEPAAPVIRIRLPVSISPIASISTSILSRGSRSSISTSRSWWEISDFPSHSSASAGVIRIFIPALMSESIKLVRDTKCSLWRGDTNNADTWYFCIVSTTESSSKNTCSPRSQDPLSDLSVEIKPLKR